ncbi:MAG: NAD(P)H-dependent oxidoreductase [Bacteroidales bacterium]|nr:NAD(P)H-dependent oxidoreductase [Bacteroidales bacterium]
MKVITFGTSISKNSINKQLAIFTSKQFNTILDLKNYPLPIYSEIEELKGIPDNAIGFYNKIREADLIIIGLAEHNGSYTAVFKNLFDWMSRYQSKMFENKQVILQSTSPGIRGAKSVMEAALTRFPIHGAEIIGHFSLPEFAVNFAHDKGIISDYFLKEYTKFIAACKNKLDQ